jgi:hypothetical protein
MFRKTDLTVGLELARKPGEPFTIHVQCLTSVSYAPYYQQLYHESFGVYHWGHDSASKIGEAFATDDPRLWCNLARKSSSILNNISNCTIDYHGITDEGYRGIREIFALHGTLLRCVILVPDRPTYGSRPIQLYQAMSRVPTSPEVQARPTRRF